MNRPEYATSSAWQWIEYADWLAAENKIKWQEGFDVANGALGLMTDKRNALDEENAKLRETITSHEEFFAHLGESHSKQYELWAALGNRR
jgi:hypothetical protein